MPDFDNAVKIREKTPTTSDPVPEDFLFPGAGEGLLFTDEEFAEYWRLCREDLREDTS